MRKTIEIFIKAAQHHTSELALEEYPVTREIVRPIDITEDLEGGRFAVRGLSRSAVCSAES